MQVASGKGEQRGERPLAAGTVARGLKPGLCPAQTASRGC